jgi:predicted RNA-binding protein YlqC (UPF0109 family)
MFDESEERTQSAPLDEEDDLAEGEYDDEPFENSDVAADTFESEEFGEVAAVGSGSPGEDLRRLVHYLATNLVDEPEHVVVDAEQRGQIVSLTLRVPEYELGKVIGRQGRIARAIRTILTIASARHSLRASLDIEG